ncbi:hypothetical protein PHPALM_18183, partial [Phytophthora palmivora]
MVATIHERILQQVERNELCRSSNNVLTSELSVLQREVSEVVATFAKVEEVRDAVNQLEQGKPSSGRSVGLMEVMNNTMELQRKLEGVLDKIAAGMAVVRLVVVQSEGQIRTKRTRQASSSSGSSSSSESSSSSSSSSEEEEEKPMPKKQKQAVEKQSKLQKTSGAGSIALRTGDPGVHLALASWEMLSNIRTVNKEIQFDMKTNWTKGLFNIKEVLKQQARYTPKETVIALRAAIAVFKQLDWTVEHVYEVQSLVASLSRTCCTNEALAKYFHGTRAQLEHLEAESFKSMRKKVAEGGKTFLERLLWSYRGLMKSMKGLDPSEMPQRIAETLSMLETVMGPQELHRSANSVLHEEFSALDQSITDVVAAFAKVEEVRDAVNQLEQGKPSSGRSMSLMEAMDSTMGLQKEVQHKLKKVAAEMKVTDVEDGERDKRKRTETEDESSSSDSSSSSSDSSSSDEEEEETVQKKQKKEQLKTKETEPEETKRSADLQLAHRCLNVIYDVKAGADMTDKWTKAILDIKLILQHQSKCDAYTTDNPAAEVTARSLEAAVSVFRRMGWTVDRAKEVRSLIAALTDACTKNEVLRFFFH